MSEIEINTTPPVHDIDRQSPLSKRLGLSRRFWFKLITGCITFAGLLDFLKGIFSVNIQAPSVLIGGALCIALTLLMRNLPDRARQLHIARTVIASMTVAILALFGVQAQIPGDSQKGAIAQTFDWAERLQVDIRELLKATQALNPRQQAIDYLSESGYPVSLEGFSRAAGFNDGEALAAYSAAGFKVSAEEFSELLREVSAKTETLNNVLSAMSYLSAEDRTRLSSSATATIRTAGEDYGLNKIRSTACGLNNPVNWIYQAVRIECENEAQWYVQARTTLSTLAQHFSEPLTFSSYKVDGNFGRFEDLNNRQSNVLLRFRALANFRNGQIYLYSNDLRTQVGEDYSSPIPALDCSDTICSVDIHATIFDRRLEILDVREIQAGPFSNPKAQLNAGQSFDWMVGYTPRWGNLVSEHAVYMATYNAQTQVGAAILCEPTQEPGGKLTLRYIFNVAPQQAYDHLFQNGNAGNQSDVIHIQLANGTNLDGYGYRRGPSVRDVMIYDSALEAILSSSSMTFKPSLSEKYPIDTRTLQAVFTQFQPYSSCSQINPTTLTSISDTESRWAMGDDTNSLSGEREVIVFTDATEVSGRGAAPVTLYLRCRDNTTEGFIIWRRPLQKTAGRNTVLTAFRLDGGPVRSEHWNLANTNEGAFFPKWSGNLAREIYRAESFVAQVPVIGEGDITATFNISGGHTKLETLAQVCGWDIRR